MMRKAMLGLAVAAGVAHAGFVDERSAQPAATADSASVVSKAAERMESAGSVFGSFSHSGWNEMAPAGATSRPLVTAFASLLPPSHPSVSIQGPEDLLDEMVTWKAGVSRIEALKHIAKAYAIDFTLQPSAPGSTLIVSKAVGSSQSKADAVVAVGRWEILPTDTKLATALERWSRQAGYSFRWDAGRHAQIEGAHTFVGTFESAVRGALDTPGIANSAYPLESCIYPNNPLLLRVTRKGEQAKDCPISE